MSIFQVPPVKYGKQLVHLANDALHLIPGEGAAAIGTTYEDLNVWIFVNIIPAAMSISILMNLYFIWKSVRHECVLREDNS